LLELSEISSLDFEVFVLTRSRHRLLKDWPELEKMKKFSLLEGDVRSFSLPKGLSFTHLIHGASPLNFPDSPENELEILEGTRHVLESISLSPLKRVLYLSSGAVYGGLPFSCSRLKEDQARLDNPSLSYYGRGKLRSEMLIQEISRANDIGSVSARIFAVAGPYIPPRAHFALSEFIGNLLNEKPIEIKGDGTALRSYIYGADLTLWLWKLLLHPKAEGPYNIGSESVVSIFDLARQLSLLAGATEDSVRLLGKAQNRVHSYIPNISKAKALGLPLHFDSTECIKLTWDWCKGAM
jgi:dTDP-glucose 4,6-dehydratase